MPVFLILVLIFFAIRAALRDLEVHSHKSRFPFILFLFPRVHASLIFLNASLKATLLVCERGAGSVEWRAGSVEWRAGSVDCECNSLRMK